MLLNTSNLTGKYKMVNFAIIGCGKIGNRHVDFLKGMDGIRVLGVADNIEERARNTALFSRSEAFTDYRELLKNPEIDVVNICSPTGLHPQMTIDALNAGKHVICEKPMALKVKDADLMIEAAKRNNKNLFVVKQNRFNRPIEILKDALNKNMFGKLYSLNVNVIWNRTPEYYLQEGWRGTKDLDGGALATQASHFVDMIQWIGGPIKSVFAKTNRFLHNIETEDTGNVLLSFESGAFGSMQYTTCAYNQNIEGSLTVLGTKGTAKIGGEYLNKIEFWNVGGYPLPEESSESYPANEYGSYRGSSSKHDSVLREAIRKIIGDDNAEIVDGSEGRKTVELIEAVHRSAETGKEVSLPLDA
jgi:UDP-N-acetyl-2-amino-2-deoxyglucuronate dehydrogenase